MTDKNLGHATAYGYAKSKGYTGTEEEFAELMASYADVAESAKGYAEQAEASATNAETSASNAQASATSASTKASEASQSATNAQQSATNASSSASSASTSASSASASAQTASTKASEASDSATSASESASTAVSAKDDAVTAKEEAETAKADAEKASEEAQESAQTVANKADKDGTYPDMTVGGVMSSDGSTDSTPYLYRESGGGVEVGKVEADEIVGGSIAWNQLISIPTNSVSKTENGVTITDNRDGSYTVQTDAGGATAQTTVNISAFVSVKQHRILVCGLPSNAGASLAYFCNTWQGADYVRNIVATVNTNSGKGDINIYVANGAVITTPMTFRPQVFDLTAMFGSTIADYIYSLEQSSTGAGVAFFRSLFPKDYYEYNTGELLSVEGVSAHVMRDADDNIIGSYHLDSSLTLRGIPKVADGKMYFDGDTYEADGTVTRKYGVVDLGTLKWLRTTVQKYDNIRYFTAGISATTAKFSNTTVANAICAKYQTASANDGYAKSINPSVTIDEDGILSIYDSNSNYTDASTFKSAMSGVMLVYELATPTTESAEPYDSIQKVSKYGTEEYVSTGIVPVGHVTKYPTDIVAKVDGLPSDFSTLIAPTEKEFKASRAYSVNQFIIVNNQLYRVTSAIANGATITVGTNVVATTIAEILTALLNA